THIYRHVNKTATVLDDSADDRTQATTLRNQLKARPLSFQARRSVTLFAGNEGEEKAQRTFNYNFNGNVIKTTTILEYSADVLTQSRNWRNEVQAAPLDSDARRSVTLFAGNEGEAKAQRTFNYK